MLLDISSVIIKNGRSDTMNIYHQLNEMIEYIENHLDKEISYLSLAHILGVNEYTMNRLFSLLCNISLTEYIRKRRLSQSGFDLYYNKCKIIDVALKYGYENATSFSRAFEKFHGIKPSEIKKGKLKFNNFPKIVFDENQISFDNIEYEIIELEEIVLYGKGIETNDDKISKDAPEFWDYMKKDFFPIYGFGSYGMVKYEDRFESYNYEYYILWDKKIENFEKIVIPKSKWLIFHIPSMKAEDIQKVANDFYNKFFPSCKYNLRDIPELEYYHDDVTDFLVPIE